MDSILLVEDNPLNRMVIEDLFDYDNVPATLFNAETGEEGFEMVKRLRPLLVLMDLELPGINGVETMLRIKADPELHDTAVWALTAHAMKSDVETALAAGFDGYVTKPVDSKTVVEKIRRFLADVTQKETPHTVSHEARHSGKNSRENGTGKLG